MRWFPDRCAGSSLKLSLAATLIERELYSRMLKKRGIVETIYKSLSLYDGLFKGVNVEITIKDRPLATAESISVSASEPT